MPKNSEGFYLKRFGTLKTMIKSNENKKLADEAIALYKESKITNRTADNIITRLAGTKTQIEKAVKLLNANRVKKTRKGVLKAEIKRAYEALEKIPLYYVNGEFVRDKW